MVLTMTKPKSHSPAIDAACGCLPSLLIAAMRLPGPDEGDRATELLMTVDVRATTNQGDGVDLAPPHVDPASAQVRYFELCHDRPWVSTECRR